MKSKNAQYDTVPLKISMDGSVESQGICEICNKYFSSDFAVGKTIEAKELKQMIGNMFLVQHITKRWHWLPAGLCWGIGKGKYGNAEKFRKLPLA